MQTMKQARCRDIRGACDTIIYGRTPDEMGDNIKKHVAEMLEKGDQAHIDAVEAMKNIDMQEFLVWKKNFDDTFDQLEDATETPE